ncbi:MAG TPA: hypothetical protein VJ695_03880 [Nitrososphaera sp.]|nr:hypothetical protein [Nitrososphaera sp.]
MSTSNNGKRRKPFFILKWCTGAFIVALTLLAGDFSPISLATVIATPSNTTSTTTLSSPRVELSSQPVYQEHVRDVSEILINQTHAHLIVEGNGTLTLPNSTESIRTTSTGSGIVSIFSTFAGKEVMTTEDGSENATVISYEIARSNKEQGIGRGISIAVIHTNSTGMLAPLDGMMLVGLEEFQPDGRALLTYWEWQSGIPYVKMQMQPMIQESPMNTTEIPPELTSTPTQTNVT